MPISVNAWEWYGGFCCTLSFEIFLNISYFLLPVFDFMCLYNKKGMNTWNDIYDFSEKVLSYILRKKEEEYIQPDQDSPVEKMADKLGNSETLAERLQQQYRYDPIRAYRKLKNYRRRRRIRRYSVAAGILLVLGLEIGRAHV